MSLAIVWARLLSDVVEYLGQRELLNAAGMNIPLRLKDEVEVSRRDDEIRPWHNA